MKATYLNVELGENVESFRLTKQSQNSRRQKIVRASKNCAGYGTRQQLITAKIHRSALIFY
jgi:hypothetical protein